MFADGLKQQKSSIRRISDRVLLSKRQKSLDDLQRGASALSRTFAKARDVASWLRDAGAVAGRPDTPEKHGGRIEDELAGFRRDLAPRLSKLAAFVPTEPVRKPFRAYVQADGPIVKSANDCLQCTYGQLQMAAEGLHALDKVMPCLADVDRVRHLLSAAKTVMDQPLQPRSCLGQLVSVLSQWLESTGAVASTGETQCSLESLSEPSLPAVDELQLCLHDMQPTDEIHEEMCESLPDLVGRNECGRTSVEELAAEVSGRKERQRSAGDEQGVATRKAVEELKTDNLGNVGEVCDEWLMAVYRRCCAASDVNEQLEDKLKLLERLKALKKQKAIKEQMMSVYGRQILELETEVLKRGLLII